MKTNRTTNPSTRPDSRRDSLRVNGRPSLTVDTVIFSILENRLKVLLVRRRNPPFQGFWAIPGGFVEADESLEEAARRELFEETGVRQVYLEQLYTFGDPLRDPRGRVVTVVYFALVRGELLRPRASTDASSVAWYPLDTLPQLAFDHRQILAYAAQRLRYKLEYTAAAFDLVPRRFTLTELQKAYEIVLGKRMDKRNFRRKLLALGIVRPLPERKRERPHPPSPFGLPPSSRLRRTRLRPAYRRGGQAGRRTGRPARLHRFDPARFSRIARSGVLFEF